MGEPERDSPKYGPFCSGVTLNLWLANMAF
jgi:hypothetical protein